ncbi:BA14K family protein [Rhizobium sp. S152]|uniref:BA14K family protein n=1 Tax=Rhizobium sp. S152 TaxID=3055038 RepID=UPI003FA77395
MLCISAAVTVLCGQAQAFSRIGSSGPEPSQAKGALAGYVQEDRNPGNDGFLLSPAEIKHIRWCATQYRSYDPTEDTFVSPAGARTACRSPH